MRSFRTSLESLLSNVRSVIERLRTFLTRETLDSIVPISTGESTTQQGISQQPRSPELRVISSRCARPATRNSNARQQSTVCGSKRPSELTLTKVSGYNGGVYVEGARVIWILYTPTTIKSTRD